MAQANVAIETTEEKWHASPVISYKGPIESVRKYIPKFERRSFGPSLAAPLYRGEPTLFENPEVPSGVNPWYDTIVRMPLASKGTNVSEIPVGIVSPQYTLLQHHTVIDEALKAIGALGINSSQVTAGMDLTHFGERMRLGLVLPEEFSLTLDGDDRMALSRIFLPRLPERPHRSRTDPVWSDGRRYRAPSKASRVALRSSGRWGSCRVEQPL